MSAEPAGPVGEQAEPAKKPARKRTTKKKPAKRAAKKVSTSTSLTLRGKPKGYTPVGRRPTAPSMIEARRKSAEAVELRAAGLSYPQIAKQMGYADESGAYRAVMRALEAMVPESLEYVRRVEVRRLDALWRPLYVQALRGDRLAADRCIKIMERRAAMLGLDAPIRIQQMVITEEQLDEAIERIEAEADALEAKSWADGESIPDWDDEDGDDGLGGVPAVI